MKYLIVFLLVGLVSCGSNESTKNESTKNDSIMSDSIKGDSKNINEINIRLQKQDHIMKTNIFNLTKDQILKIEIINHRDSERSFSIEKIEDGYNVMRSGKELDLTHLNRYLSNYESVHFDSPNYEMNETQIDSIKNTNPFCELILTDINEQRTHLKMFEIKSINSEANEFGEYTTLDMNKFWCELTDGTLVKCDYREFYPLIISFAYFP